MREMCPLTVEEEQAVLDARHSRRACDPLYRAPGPPARRPPGQPRARLRTKDGGLAVARLTWEFPLDGKPNAVFNTRMEFALEQLRLGGRGMWAKAIAQGRCLVPVRAFYEGHMTERAESEKSGRPVR